MAKLKSGCREDKLERSGGYLKSGETAARNLSCIKIKKFTAGVLKIS